MAAAAARRAERRVMAPRLPPPAAGGGHQPAGTSGAPDPQFPAGIALCVAEHVYDGVGNRVSSTSAGAKTTTWGYSNDHLVTSVTAPDPAGGGTVSFARSTSSVRPARGKPRSCMHATSVASGRRSR